MNLTVLQYDTNSCNPLEVIALQLICYLLFVREWEFGILPLDFFYHHNHYLCVKMTSCVCSQFINIYNNNTPIIREMNIVRAISMSTYHNVDLEQHNVYVYLLNLLSALWRMDHGFFQKSLKISVILESMDNNTSEILMSLYLVKRFILRNKHVWSWTTYCVAWGQFCGYKIRWSNNIF